MGSVKSRPPPFLNFVSTPVLFPFSHMQVSPKSVVLHLAPPRLALPVAHVFPLVVTGGAHTLFPLWGRVLQSFCSAKCQAEASHDVHWLTLTPPLGSSFTNVWLQQLQICCWYPHVQLLHQQG